MKDKKVLVTGGAGFIGSHLVDALLKRGAEVYVYDNLDRGSAENLQHCIDDISFFEGDLTEGFQISDLKPDYVFELAAKVYGITNLYKVPATMMRDNVRIVANVLKHCAEVGVEKYIYLSSSCVYDHDNVQIPHKEDDVGLVNSFYGWSKFYGEILCEAFRLEHGLNYSIARPFNVYGPRESLEFPHVIPDFIMKAARCKYEGEEFFEIYGSGNQTRSFTYIEDVVEGLILIAKKGKPESYNLGAERETRILVIASTIFDEFEIYPEIKWLPTVKGDVKRRCADGAKARRELGWDSKVDIDEGIRRTIEWYLDKAGKR